MAFREKAAEEANRKKTDADRPRRRGGSGRLPVVFLCLLLIGAGTALMYADVQRDYRHGVYRCEGGRMMEEPAVPDEEVIRKAAAGLQAVAVNHPDLEQYMMIVPVAACVQSDYLPSRAKVRDQAADLAVVRQSMPQGLEWIDLLTLLRTHAGEKLYYATDTYLTGWGSRYAAKTALAAMGAGIPEGQEKCYLLSNSFEGKLAKDRNLLQRFLKKKTERLEIYVPEAEALYYREDIASGKQYGSLYDAAAADTAEPFDVFFGGERPLTEIHSTAANGKTLMVVGDRTADSVVPLFVSSYENIVLVHPETCGKSLEGLIGKYGPDQILYLYSANSFVQDRALLHALGQ